MAMRVEYHKFPDLRGRDLPSKPRSIPLSLVEMNHLLHTGDKFKNLQTIMKEYIDIIIDDKMTKRKLSTIKSKIEQIIQSTDMNILQEYLKSLHKNNFQSNRLKEKSSSIFLFNLIAYHLLVKLKKENSTDILNVIEDKLLQSTMDLDVSLLYLKVYYKDNPNKIFTNIHAIWKSDPTTELHLKLAYCTKLNEAKDSKTLKQLINHHADSLTESFKEEKNTELCNKDETTAIVLFQLLHYQVSINNMEKVKIIETILFRPCMSSIWNVNPFLFNRFYNFILTFDNKQILCTPYVVKLLQPVMKKQPSAYLKIILLCGERLRQTNHYMECIKLIKCHFQFISSFPIDELKFQEECYSRQQYCITLFLLLDEYVSCHDTQNMNLVLATLLKFRVNFHSDMYCYTCYCLMGNKECMTTLSWGKSFRISLVNHTSDFKKHLLDGYIKRLLDLIASSNSNMFQHLHAHENIFSDFNLVMEKVIQGELELAPYLQSLVDIISMGTYRDESVAFFIEFIQGSADHNEAILYLIIQNLCAFDLQPEIQNLITQQLTLYLMISCNRQYGLMSKFILDINMICPKGQFLQTLTSGIATLSLKFDEDTVNDFRKTIYKCYCTVRNDSKNGNITRYKDHFTFIAPMEVKEDNMKRLTALANFLLMLVILFITIGGHHKSAELKKYLSLKYEYRDSILYLLWCAGDVEINPGPTFRTLRKVPDSVKERNWIYEMCSILLRLLKYRSIDLKNDGLWKAKPLHWPNGWPFYDPRNKPKGQGYNTATDRKLLENLEEHCHVEGILKDLSKFDDEHTKSKVRQYKMEITAWKNNRTELFELYTLRQEKDTLRAAKKSLHQYKNERELHEGRSDLNIDFNFDTVDVTSFSSEGYTDIVRDIAITFCRIGKGLRPLEKSDGIWKTPPSGWNPNHSYFSPCNAGKRKEKGQYQKLVDNLLTYCESKNVTIPSELQPLLKAWKQRNTSEITKSYTIWSKTAIIKHSLQYLQLEGILEKIHVQESLEQISGLLDTQHWRCPSVNTSCTSDYDDKIQDPGFSENLPSSSNSTAKIASIQINSNNPSTQLSNSTQTNTKDTPASPHSSVCHTDGHLCNVAPDQQHHRNQSSKHTCVNSFKDSCPILTSKEQPEADGNPQPIASVNSSTWIGEVIPCTVQIHDATSKIDSNNRIYKTAKKRGKQKNDESPSEPKRLHISEEDVPLLLNILISPSENGKVLSNTKRKDGTIRTISPYQFPHHLISIQSRLNPSAAKKQTDKLVVKDLTDIASDQLEDPSVSERKDGDINKANKNNKTTSDQYVDKIVDLLEDLDQDYSSVVVQQTIPISCSSTDQSSDSSDELPEPIKLCVDTYLNSYNSDDTLETDIEQFIEEQGMDSS